MVVMCQWRILCERQHGEFRRKTLWKNLICPPSRNLNYLHWVARHHHRLFSFVYEAVLCQTSVRIVLPSFNCSISMVRKITKESRVSTFNAVFSIVKTQSSYHYQIFLCLPAIQSFVLLKFNYQVM